MRGLGFILAAGMAAGCASFSPKPPREPGSLDQGLLIARIEAHGAFFFKSTKWADAAKIIGLDAQGRPDPELRFKSALAVNGYVVFFGLPAGRYVLTGASFPARGVNYSLAAPEDMPEKRAVLLRPGTAAYLGDHGFDSVFPEFWVMMGRAARIVAHWATPFLRRPQIPRDAGMHVFEKGPVAETRALLAVRSALARTQWSRLVAARLRELQAAEPAKKIVGVIRTREMPLRAEPFLSWRDTLHWGEPRRAESGLAWRKPGGDAQIAVFFTTASTPGFAGWGAAVAELRRSASASVEDQGGIYEVRVATRTGLASRATKYRYLEGTLVGSETQVIVTETTLVPDGFGLYTARLRAPRAEFDAAVPAYREFLTQLVLGKAKPKVVQQQEAVMPFVGGAP
jgi:hypothetical protein